MKRIALALLAWWIPARVEAAKVEVLPGASQKISHAMSASRDTALLAYQLTPYSVLTAGGDFALVSLQGRQIGVRFGFFGLFELESSRPFESEGKTYGPALPFQDVHLWRGHNGVQAAISFDAFARQLLGPRGVVELTVGFRHESEHFTGSTSGSKPRYQDVPHIGDFLLHDFAARVPLGRVDLEVRLQWKTFLTIDTGQANGGYRAYLAAPGGDVVLRWRLASWLHPFTSTFAEYVFGNPSHARDGLVMRVPDHYLVRNLTGVVLPNAFGGGLQLFASFAVGHGKGLHVLREELLVGGGVRVALL